MTSSGIPLSANTASLTLADGRQLAYVRWNEQGRHALLFCHGTPGSRLFRPPDISLLLAHDVDLVTVDRPGYGRSTPQPHRRLLDWPRDVLALTEHFGWRRFVMAGISGGGPHALACGFALQKRVSLVGVISSVAPYWPHALKGMLPVTRRAFELARWAPWLLTLAARWTSSRREQFVANVSRDLPDCDRRVLSRPEVAQVAHESSTEALMSDAMAAELVLLRRSWGFPLPDVRNRVLLWHGELDRNVPIAHGRRIAAALPNCRPIFVPDAGHYLVFDQWSTILKDLSAAM